jgi:ABC-2 type transport system permease protein
MAEMELAADHLIVIGGGRLIADTDMRRFIEHDSQPVTLARSPQPDRLTAVLTDHGAQVRLDPGGAWRVSGIDTATIGDIANTHHIALHELSSRFDSLEEVYTRMTGASVEYAAPRSPAPARRRPPTRSDVHGRHRHRRHDVRPACAVRCQRRDPARGVPQALAAEWTKIRTVRSTVWTLATMAAATVGIAVIVAATASLQHDDTILAGSLGNTAPGQIAAGILGALVVSGEYASGTIRATFAACPYWPPKPSWSPSRIRGGIRRGAVRLPGRDCHAVRARLPTGKPMPCSGSLSATPRSPVLGVALGTALRHSAAAVTAVTGVMLLPTLVGPLLGSWQRWIAGASPVAALPKLTRTSPPPKPSTAWVPGPRCGWFAPTAPLR